MRVLNFKRLQPGAQKALKLAAKSTDQELITEVKKKPAAKELEPEEEITPELIEELEPKEKTKHHGKGL